MRIADPAFIGYHSRHGADISTKVVRRQNKEEKVGIYGTAEGKCCIVEYSDLRPEDYLAVDHQGNLRHWAGNIAVHVISLSFIERLNRRGFALPYHRAVKEVEGLGPDGDAGQNAGVEIRDLRLRLHPPRGEELLRGGPEGGRVRAGKKPIRGGLAGDGTAGDELFISELAPRGGGGGGPGSRGRDQSFVCSR